MTPLATAPLRQMRPPADFPALVYPTTTSVSQGYKRRRHLIPGPCNFADTPHSQFFDNTPKNLVLSIKPTRSISAYPTTYHVDSFCPYHPRAGPPDHWVHPVDLQELPSRRLQSGPADARSQPLHPPDRPHGLCHGPAIVSPDGHHPGGSPQGDQPADLGTH